MTSITAQLHLIPLTFCTHSLPPNSCFQSSTSLSPTVQPTQSKSFTVIRCIWTSCRTFNTAQLLFSCTTCSSQTVQPSQSNCLYLLVIKYVWTFCVHLTLLFSSPTCSASAVQPTHCSSSSPTGAFTLHRTLFNYWSPPVPLDLPLYIERCPIVPFRMTPLKQLLKSNPLEHLSHWLIWSSHHHQRSLKLCTNSTQATTSIKVLSMFEHKFTRFYGIA